MLRDDLIAARALIDTPENWRRHTLGLGTDRFCALGACAEITGARAEHFERVRYNAMKGALRSALPKGQIAAVTNYNDDPSTTHADIMALFDRAIAAAGAP